jgi:hypothetical protein
MESFHILFTHLMARPHKGENKWSPKPELQLSENIPSAIRQCQPFKAKPCLLIVFFEFFYRVHFLATIVHAKVIYRQLLLFIFWLVCLCFVELVWFELHLFEKLVQIVFTRFDVSKHLYFTFWWRISHYYWLILWNQIYTKLDFIINSWF